MAGERTPDTNDGGHTSSDDDISLREHLQRQLDAARWESARAHEELKAYFERVIAEHRVQLDERYKTQTTALDKAFDSADKAVQAALVGAEKAVSKAESAAERRFESVNEFRGQLADQANTFIPRAEATVRIDGMAEKVEANARRVNDLELRISNRLSTNDGRSYGVDKTVAWIFAAAGFVGTVVALLVR